MDGFYLIAAIGCRHINTWPQGLSRAVPIRATPLPQDDDYSTLSVNICEEREHRFAIMVAQQTLVARLLTSACKRTG